MTRHSVALGIILGLVSGTFFTAVRAKGQSTAPGTPVHMCTYAYITGQGCSMLTL
jgi:hypothetical protein